MKYFKKLVGKQIYLSPMNVDDGEIYTKWMNDYAVSGFLGNFSHMISLQGERKALERMSTEGQNFSIVLLEDDCLIGNISLMELDHISRTGTIGLFIGESENRGKGYGTEALRLILAYGFQTLNLHNIMLLAHADNTAGLACYQKAGFREFGRRKEARFKDSRYVDVVYMEILESEYHRKNN